MAVNTGTPTQSSLWLGTRLLASRSLSGPACPMETRVPAWQRLRGEGRRQVQTTQHRQMLQPQQP